MFWARLFVRSVYGGNIMDNEINGYDSCVLEVLASEKPVWGMENWWIEEDYSPDGWTVKYDRLRGD